MAKGLQAYHAMAAKPAKVGPSLPLARYVGTFSDPCTGNIEIALVKGKLTIDFKSTPRMGGTLEHWQYDSFTTKFDDKNIEPAYVNFGLDADGKGRAHHDEAGLAARRFQLRLSGSDVQPPSQGSSHGRQSCVMAMVLLSHRHTAGAVCISYSVLEASIRRSTSKDAPGAASAIDQKQTRPTAKSFPHSCRCLDC